jgi:hypothetical protein
VLTTRPLTSESLFSRNPEENPQLKAKILNALEGRQKMNFLELESATKAAHGELVAALEALLAEGLLLKSSDGFVTTYSRRV